MSPAPSAAPSSFDPNDEIYQAMMAQALQPSAAAPAPAPTQKPAPVRAPVPARKAPLVSAFAEEEEEGRPQRRLIPLQYTEEERKAATAASTAPGAVLVHTMLCHHTSFCS